MKPGMPIEMVNLLNRPKGGKPRPEMPERISGGAGNVARIIIKRPPKKTWRCRKRKGGDD